MRFERSLNPEIFSALGAVVTAMIASRGDEAFVMLALIPRPALILMGIVFGIGLGAGVLVDVVSGRRRTRHPAACFEAGNGLDGRVHLDRGTSTGAVGSCRRSTSTAFN